jgi:4,5-dihydroxyphthalate decarboxylase
MAIDGLYDTDALRLALPWLIDHVEEARCMFGDDYWPYGAEKNRNVWTAFCGYQVEQGLAARSASLDELFVVG